MLALLSGRPADRYLDAQRAAHLARMRELTNERRAGGLAETLVADAVTGSELVTSLESARFE